MNGARWHKITGIFHAALARDLGGRQDFIHEACQNDVALQKDVEKLLAVHEAASLADQMLGPMAGPDRIDRSSTGRPRKLGPYELFMLLGRGGMGEVYKGRDTRLNRTVAIKILARELTDSAEARRRFHQEAQAIAALNHRHVCAIHDVGHASGVDFLVMEYVDGESLADRLTRGSLPLDEVLARASEFLDALAHAHEAGVVHRDIKPSNVMLTKSGAKLLDFGIATLRRGSGETATFSDIPRTDPSRVVGTLQYMAPEQLTGGSADARTDIFGCGLMLYEMVTGRRAVAGDHTTTIITEILTGKPASICDVLPHCPPDLDWAVQRCLARDASARWQSAADLSAVLRWIQKRPAGVTSAPQSVLQTTVGRVAMRSAATAAVLLVTVIAAGFVWSRWNEAEKARGQAILAAIPLVNGAVLGGDGLPAVALSGDGRRVVYAARVNATTMLYLRVLDRLESVPLPGTEDATGPFFSPDGNSVGFFAQQKLKRVTFDGTPPAVICNAPRGRGGAWAADDTIVFAPSSDGPLLRVSAKGGQPEPTSRLALRPRERSHRWPELLPGGRVVLYTSGNPTDTAFSDTRIVAQSIDDPADRRVLLENASYARYSAGHLVFVAGHSLRAVRFDPAALTVTGTPFTIVNVLSNSRFIGAPQMAVSSEGALVYLPAGGGGTHMTLAWVRRDGTATPIPSVRGILNGVRLSPDGSRVAVASSELDADVYVYDLARQTLQRATFGPEFEGNPVWFTDGTRIVYASERGPGVQMFWKRWDDPRGSPGALAQAPPQDDALAAGEYARIPHAWSADGHLLAFTENHPDSRRDIWLMSAEAPEKSRPVIASPFEDTFPTFSPDGLWLAYQSNESGGNEIYAHRIAGGPTRIQITHGGGAVPRWAASGDLFYSTAGKMFVVPIRSGPDTLDVGAPKELFPVESLPFYDVTPDGQRLLMLQPEAAAYPRDLMLLDNWASAASR